MKKLQGYLSAALLVTASVANAQVPVSTSYSNEAWKVTRDWDEKSTEAGIAWGANSGLNWQQKFAAWVQSMKKIARTGGEGFTFEVTTPYGKTLPAPVLDCADGAMAMRLIFASWYGLPVLVRAGKNYYGHFGVRIGSATATSQANCSASKCDFSKYTAADIATKPWPSYSGLKSKSVGSDANPALGGVKLGGYLDQLLLNKRVGYVVVRLLSDAGSMNLAGSLNLYDIKPEAIQAGDVLLERWQAEGIGHTVLMKSAVPVAGGKIRVESAQGWLPPQQLKYQGPFDTYELLTDPTTGGNECVDYNVSSCTPAKTYAAFGGGIKRWRAPKKVGGKWTMSVLDADKAIAIKGSDYATLGKRPDQFENILYLPPPNELRDEIIAAINTARASLRNKPSGCAARTRREDAFKELYELGAASFSMDQLAIDKTYRKVEDYVFWPLDYTKSPTCCWNGATAQMGASVVATAKTQAAKNPCTAPLVFKKTNGDYQPYRGAATGVTWKAYANDENCAQGGQPNDTEMPVNATPYCTIRSFIHE